MSFRNLCPRAGPLTRLLLACCALTGPAMAVPWDGPNDGPVAQPGKKIVYVAQDMRNGGISGVFRGLQEATRQLGWQLSYVDGGGNAAAATSLFAEAVQHHPDAIAIGGFGIEELTVPVAFAQDTNIVLVGWHAAAQPGPTDALFVNVATDPAAVAQAAADYVIWNASGPVGAVLINDGRFSVANAKTQKIKEILESCATCSVLAVEDIKISEASALIPDVIRRLNLTYAARWTHTIAVNDVYFDNMNFPLREIGRLDIRNISAGDGSARSLERIRTGYSQQVATVAEPLTLQGWQLADEMNRAFAGVAPSGYVSKPILITRQVLEALGDVPIDSTIPFEARYAAIWHGKVP